MPTNRKTLFITDDAHAQLQALQFRIQMELAKRVTFAQMIAAMCALSDNNYNALIDILSKEIN